MLAAARYQLHRFVDDRQYHFGLDLIAIQFAGLKGKSRDRFFGRFTQRRLRRIDDLNSAGDNIALRVHHELEFHQATNFSTLELFRVGILDQLRGRNR